MPCVVTDCVDFREIIAPGLNGHIVQKADVDSLVKGILNAKSIDFQMGVMTDFDYNTWFSTLNYFVNTTPNPTKSACD